MKALFLRNWSFMRIFRIALGLIVAAQGWDSNEWIFIVLGLIFAVISFLNLGCSAYGSNCSYKR
ncbi:hypothetical protein [Sphingobacterium paucimobilis]|uniref:DUF2892 domain-containing protein n=1 Tax=Sphingobacterium paucimobilis HER1398 TaxID=1346330 RepID=U2J8H4_9SPHI|nr:hypothetical protein [Sphingobacterium paucimobilis]ERJ61239.1 hypothetical protein M472_21025 [Sphingobacterium paucimobilis HER1398]